MRNRDEILEISVLDARANYIKQKIAKRTYGKEKLNFEKLKHIFMTRLGRHVLKA